MSGVSVSAATVAPFQLNNNPLVLPNAVTQPNNPSVTPNAASQVSSAANTATNVQKMLQVYEAKALETLQHVQTLKKDNPSQALSTIEKLIELLTVTLPGKLDANVDLKKFKVITADAYFTQAHILFEQQKDEPALKAFSSAYEMNPQMHPALHWKGYLLAKLNQYKEALDCFDQVLQADPTNETAATYKKDLLELMQKRPKTPSAPPEKSSPVVRASSPAKTAPPVKPRQPLPEKNEQVSQLEQTVISLQKTVTLLQTELKQLRDDQPKQMQQLIQDEISTIVKKWANEQDLFRQRLEQLEMNVRSASSAPPIKPQLAPNTNTVSADKLDKFENRMDKWEKEYYANHELVKKALSQEKLERECLSKELKQFTEDETNKLKQMTENKIAVVAHVQQDLSQLQSLTKSTQQTLNQIQGEVESLKHAAPPVQTQPSAPQSFTPEVSIVHEDSNTSSLTPRSQPPPATTTISIPKTEPPILNISIGTSVALFDYDAVGEDELSVKRGDLLEMFADEEEEDGWSRVELNGKIGLIPTSFTSPPQKNFSKLQGVAIYDYNAQNSEEISFKEGETIFILYQQDDGWTFGETSHSQKGVFPTTYVQQK